MIGGCLQLCRSCPLPPHFITQLHAAKAIPAIALTAYAGEFDRQQALKAGFQQHLSKPIALNELIQAIIGLS